MIAVDNGGSTMRSTSGFITSDADNLSADESMHGDLPEVGKLAENSNKSRLADLTDVTLEVLPSHRDVRLASSVERVLRRVDRPGASISGYNGAGGLSGDVDVDMTDPLA
jgi:hypothetical protein